MADDVGGAEADRRQFGDALELGDRVVEPRVDPARQIGLIGVAADHHPTAHPEPGQKHLHLRGGGVLGFVEDDERVAKGAPAHERDRRDLDFARCDPPLDLLGREHVIERVVDRPQIRIDLFLHVAGKEAEPLARLDRGTRQDQPVDLAGDQHRHRLRHREIGLARPRRAQGEDHVVAGQRLHILSLDRRARDDRLLARADHDLGRRGDLVVDDPVERGLRRHPDQRLDRRGIDVMPLVEPVVEPHQHVARARRRLGLALDHHAIAARRDMHPKPVLDRHQVAVVIPEQRPEQIGLVELQLEIGTAVERVVIGGGEVAFGHQAGISSRRRIPPRLLGSARVTLTSSMSPMRASVSTNTD